MKAQTVGDPSSLEFMRSRRVFEINPEHPIIKSLSVWLLVELQNSGGYSNSCISSFYMIWWILQAACKSSPNDEEALRAIDLLYDTALISSGFTVSSLSNNDFFPNRKCWLFDPYVAWAIMNYNWCSLRVLHSWEERYTRWWTWHF